jgi:hypothetical protein
VTVGAPANQRGLRREAFAAACKELHDVGQFQMVRELVAKRIIAAARTFGGLLILPSTATPRRPSPAFAIAGMFAMRERHSCR